VATIGAAFASKPFSFPGNSVKLSLWDVAGQERYESLWPMYSRKAQVVWITCDLSTDSYQTEAERILAKQNLVSDGATVYLVGTKLDLVVDPAERAAKEAMLKELAEANSCYCALISAKEGTHIEDLFKSAINLKLGPFTSQEQKASSAKADTNVQSVDQPVITASNQVVDDTAQKTASKQNKIVDAIKQHLKKHWKLYTLGLVLALGVAAVLTVPGIGFAFGFSAALGYAVVSTALQLGLFAAGLGLLTFTLVAGIGIGIAVFQARRRGYEKIEGAVPPVGPSSSYSQVPTGEAAAATVSVQADIHTTTPVTSSPIGAGATGQQANVGIQDTANLSGIRQNPL
jgi:small GTP-binding protein